MINRFYQIYYLRFNEQTNSLDLFPIKIRVQYERKVGNTIVGSFGFDSVEVKANRAITTQVSSTEETSSGGFTTEILSTTEVSQTSNIVETSENPTVDDSTISTETQPLYSTTYDSSPSEETTTTLSSELPTNEPVLTTIEPLTPEIVTSSSTGTIRPTTVETKEPTNAPIITGVTDSVTPEVVKTTESVDQTSESSKPTLAPITSPLPTLAPITEEPESSTKSPDSGLNVYHWIGIGIGAILILALIFGVGYCIYKLCCYRHSDIYPGTANKNLQNGDDLEMSYNY